MSFLFKNYSLVKVIYLLIRCYKTRFFLWNTNNIDRNGANKQNIQTHTKHSEKDNTEKWYPPFFETTPYFTNPSLFMGKYEPSPYFFFFFSKILKTQTHTMIPARPAICLSFQIIGSPTIYIWGALSDLVLYTQF